MYYNVITAAHRTNHIKNVHWDKLTPKKRNEKEISNFLYFFTSSTLQRPQKTAWLYVSVLLASYRSEIFVFRLFYALSWCSKYLIIFDLFWCFSLVYCLIFSLIFVLSRQSSHSRTYTHNDKLHFIVILQYELRETLTIPLHVIPKFVISKLRVSSTISDAKNTLWQG